MKRMKIKINAERVSPLTSQGSLTLECSWALSIFLFMFLSLLQIFLILTIHSRIHTALYHTGKELGKYAYVYEDLMEGKEVNDETMKLGKSIFSMTYVKSKVLSHIESKDMGLIKGGESRINVYHSKIMEEDGIIDLIVDYKVSPLFAFFPLPDMPMVQRVRVRGWIGDGNGRGSNGDKEENKNLVYITETGSVYHTDVSCTHLRLSITQIKRNQVEEMRNEYGGKYYGCERCTVSEHNKDQVYITETGNRYHYSVSCSGLKRAITSIAQDEVGDRKLCARCGG